MHKIYPLIQTTDFPYIERKTQIQYRLIWVISAIKKCLHCHVNAGPTRKEMMGKETINQVIEFIELNQIKTVDLTGGAPEMNEHFKYLVEVCANKNIHVIDRCNLTILNEEGMSELPYFLARNKVEIVASLPCYMEENVDAQRGKGVLRLASRY